MPNDLEPVTITKKEYAELVLARRKLIALENWGVDNWGGYSIAMHEFYKEDGEEDE